MRPKDIFRIMPTNEEKSDWVVIVGKHLATERHFQTEEEALLYMDTPHWDTIIALVAEMLELNEELTQLKEQKNG